VLFYKKMTIRGGLALENGKQAIRFHGLIRMAFERLREKRFFDFSPARPGKNG
jgi:hypothetical protein